MTDDKDKVEVVVIGSAADMRAFIGDFAATPPEIKFSMVASLRFEASLSATYAPQGADRDGA